MKEKVIRGYKVKIYPTEAQANKINQTFGCVRLIWNYSLMERLEIYNLFREYPKLYKSHKFNLQKDWKIYFPFLSEVDSQALNTTQQELKSSFNNFFKNTHNLPIFKSKKNQRNSYTTHTTNHNVRMEGEYIKLPKVGWIKLKKKRRTLPGGSVIKAATISITATGKYFVSLRIEYEQEIPVLNENYTRSIGLDFSLNSFYVDSEGKKANYPMYLHKSEKKLKKLQRRLSKKVKDSNSYNNLRQQIAKHHEKVRNQRNDFHHKQSRYLVKNYDIITIETLDLKTMSQNKYFSKKVMDIGYHQFALYLSYKCHDAGKIFHKVDKYYASSKTCSNCGKKKKTLPLSMRVYTCECGNVIDRDINAAINICVEGIKTFFNKEDRTTSLA